MDEVGDLLNKFIEKRQSEISEALLGSTEVLNNYVSGNKEFNYSLFQLL
jgi:hypothetical protein